MEIHTLQKITTKKRRRLGQGHGSGRVKTSGRGTKGQNARSKRPMRFEGGALPLTKRLPFLRGKQKNKSFRPKALVLNLSNLNQLPKDTVVDIATLIKHNLINADAAKTHPVKLLADGEITVALTVAVPVSKSAQAKIEKAGGSVTS